MQRLLGQTSSLFTKEFLNRCISCTSRLDVSSCQSETKPNSKQIQRNARLRSMVASDWKDKANVVIIGGGSIGVSLAYALAKKEIKDVILLEKTELTAGSTWHAAGLVTYFNGGVNMKKAHAKCMQTLHSIEEETGQQIGFHNPGSLRLAETPTRMDEMKYQMTRGQWHPHPPQLLTPEQIHEIFPIMNMDNILGGLYTGDDGHVDPYSLTQAYATGARMYGASLLQNCSVSATKFLESGEWDVETDKGMIRTKHVVNAGGLWAREIGKLAGILLPIIPAHHQYVVTSTIPEVKALKREPPVIRDLEGSYYLRQERDGLLYGPYEPPHKMQLCDDWLESGPPQGFGKELFQPDLDRISASSEKAMELVPLLQTANIQTVVSGPITYGPDVLPQIGPYYGLHNYWVSVAQTYGIVHSGFADYLSHWIIHDEPPYECIDTEPNRYKSSWCSDEFLLAKARETYGMNNNSAFPKEVRFASRPTSRVTPIYESQKANGAQFSISAGWETADWYAHSGEEAGYKPSFRRTNWFEPVGRECRAVLNDVGIADLTSFAKYELTGPDAAAFLDYVYANEVPTEGEIKVSHLLTSRGTIYGENTVTCLSPGRYWIINGGGSELHDLRWLERKAKLGNYNVSFTNFTDEMCVLTVAGPRSRDVMSKLSSADVSDKAWPFMMSKQIQMGGADVTALRLSYTGELGWELFVKPDDMLQLYTTLLEVGSEFKMQRFGKYALDSLRQEKGMRGWGAEMTNDTNALECGLRMFVRVNKKADFIGKQALLKTKQEGLKKKLVFCTVHDTKDVDPEGNETVWLNNEVVGFTTSGCYGWQVGSSICMAYLPSELAKEGNTIQVELLGDCYPATVHTNPHVKIESRR